MWKHEKGEGDIQREMEIEPSWSVVDVQSEMENETSWRVVDIQSEMEIEASWRVVHEEECEIDLEKEKLQEKTLQAQKKE